MLNFTTSTANDFSDFGRHLWLELAELPTQEQIAQQVSERLFRALVDDDENPAAALVRVFRLTGVADLPPDVQKQVHKDEHKVMALIGTYGLEDAWCSRTRSQGHQAVPVSAIAVPQQIPMFQEVLNQLGINLEQFYATQELAIGTTYKGVFHIASVPGNPVIPAQEPFVRPYGIQSLVGFGGFMGLEEEQSLFILYVFSQVPISAEAAANFHTMQEFVGTSLASVNQVFG